MLSWLFEKSHGDDEHRGVGLEEDAVGDAGVEQAREDARLLVGDRDELYPLVLDELGDIVHKRLCGDALGLEGALRVMVAAVLHQLLQGLIHQAAVLLIDNRDDGHLHAAHVEQTRKAVKRDEVLLDEVGEKCHMGDISQPDVGHTDGHGEDGELTGIHHLAGDAADEVLATAVSAAGAHDNERYIILLGIVQNLLLGDALGNFGLNLHPR